MQEVGESASSSANKAFSSMVFMIGELHTYAMRELLLTENLNGILDRVRGEMHASFVWLFQRIFSCTPTLMLSLMLLLANFTVYHTAAVAAAAPPPATVSEHQHHTFDSSSSSTEKLSIGGGDGGGKRRAVAGATDDSGSYRGNTNAISTSPASASASEAVADRDEVSLWKGIEEDAMEMQAALRGEELMDPATLRSLVSPVTVEMEAEDASVYLKTKQSYLRALSRDPGNALLLTNFAQFLFIVLGDLDRAEHYFELALEKEPRDAESLARYASFLWVARKDIHAAEETYLEAIAADPGNSFHTANYANFLWSTGGEGTCYPI